MFICWSYSKNKSGVHFWTTLYIQYFRSKSVVWSTRAQTIYALRSLRVHGMSDSTLKMVYRSVIVAKLLYAASAWYGFSTADDRQRLEAVIRRGIWSGLCATNQLTVRELVDDADESLFTNILYNRNHILSHCQLICRTQPGSDATSDYCFKSLPIISRAETVPDMLVLMAA